MGSGKAKLIVFRLMSVVWTAYQQLSTRGPDPVEYAHETELENADDGSEVFDNDSPNLFGMSS